MAFRWRADGGPFLDVYWVLCNVLSELSPVFFSMCFLFAALVLAVTAVWVWVLKDRTFKFLAYAMFFPGVIAVLLSVYDGSVVQLLLTASGLHKVRI